MFSTASLGANTEFAPSDAVSVFAIKPKDGWYTVPNKSEDTGDQLYSQIKMKRWRPNVKLKWGDDDAHEISLRGKRGVLTLKYEFRF